MAAHLGAIEAAEVDVNMSVHDKYPLAGRLRHYIKYWRSICTDREVLALIKGATFEFTEHIHQTKPPRCLRMNEEERKFMDNKIKELLQDGSIREIVRPDPTGYISNIFLVRKREGNSFRMIVDLKNLNSKIRYRKFKIEHLDPDNSINYEKLRIHKIRHSLSFQSRPRKK